jgi:Pyruvate/2-oxoacid:ferredoxin oxidoreductase delta subunit
MLKVGHTVTVPKTLRGPKPSDEPETFPVPEELETVPGIPQSPETVNYYARNYPIESHNVEHYSYMRWDREASDIKEVRDEHERLQMPQAKAARQSGELEPTTQPVPGKDVTAEIKAKAMELGFAMVGVTSYDNRYTYLSRRKWIKPYPHAICIAIEQHFEETQKIPSESAERMVFATYRRGADMALELVDYIRSLGYRGQFQHPNDGGSTFIPMFVEAGMGQMGAMGYLLSPHFGSRHRLMIITTDAEVTYDKPVDYGIQNFCAICQVCVNRCPGRALLREKVWWRGVEKFKLIAKRCRPVMARYAACGVCMKVCPIQRYGMKAVMEHYATTGQVLGKGTHGLEGYEMHGLGYFGPGELPSFDSEFFHIPEGYGDQYLLQELRSRIESGNVPEGPEGEKVFAEFRARMQEFVKGPRDAMYADREYVEDMDEF